MNRKLAMILIFTGVFAGIAHAALMEEHPCSSTATEADMYECLTHQLKEADIALNKAYRVLTARYKENEPSPVQGKPQGSYLKKAQIAWIKFRDESCDFETYESITGSGFGTIYTACLLEKTQERVNYLQWYIEHP